MERVNFNPEWYGVQAKVLSRSERQMVVDYGCNGRGIVKNYSLFEGIQLCFLDFETDESMRAQKFNPDILQITHCLAIRDLHHCCAGMRTTPVLHCQSETAPSSGRASGCFPHRSHPVMLSMNTVHRSTSTGCLVARYVMEPYR